MTPRPLRKLFLKKSWPRKTDRNGKVWQIFPRLNYVDTAAAKCDSRRISKEGKYEQGNRRIVRFYAGFHKA